MWFWGRYRVQFHPAPTGKIIEVFTWIHTHVQTMQQLRSYGEKMQLLNNSSCHSTQTRICHFSLKLF
jgi:hypothetical protein